MPDSGKSELCTRMVPLYPRCSPHRALRRQLTAGPPLPIRCLVPKILGNFKMPERNTEG